MDREELGKLRSLVAKLKTELQSEIKELEEKPNTSLTHAEVHKRLTEYVDTRIKIDQITMFQYLLRELADKE